MGQMLRLMLFLTATQLLSIGCTSTPKAADGDRAIESGTVLIIGDSISMQNGYFKGVHGRLGEQFKVIHNPGNGGDSGNVAAHLEEWVTQASPDIIHFNCGLHDLKLNRETGAHQVPIERYHQNLDSIANWLKQNSRARLVFALTTPVNTEWHRERKAFDRLLTDVQRYNDVALEVMKRHGIPVNNLYDVIAAAGPDTCLVADGVHMNEKGNRLLAEAVTTKIREIAAGE